ncbi:MAG: hypothetical protein WAT92_16380 [Saprospiraceae bacterium]
MKRRKALRQYGNRRGVKLSPIHRNVVFMETSKALRLYGNRRGEKLSPVLPNIIKYGTQNFAPYSIDCWDA